MSIPESNRPPESIIGARIKIVADFQSEVEALFESAGVTPIYKELMGEAVSYWFGEDQMPALIESRVLDLIPAEYWAHYALAGKPPTLN